MKARKCDRCGTFYEMYQTSRGTGHANAVRLVEITPTDNTNNKDKYDLCSECMAELVNFLTTPPTASEEPVEPPTEGEESGGNTDPTEPKTPTEGSTEGVEGGDGGEST